MKHNEKRATYRILVVLSLAGLGVFIVFMCTVGAVKVPFKDSLRLVAGKIPLIGTLVSQQGIGEAAAVIVLNIRLPRILLAAFVGMGLACSGVVFQAIFRNPMADPYVLGISSGAAFGVTLGTVLGLQVTLLGFGVITLLAFCGSMLTTLLVYMLAGRNANVVMLLLAGIALSFFLSSLISFIMIFNRDHVANIVFWTMGSFSAASWKKLLIAVPAIVSGCLVLGCFTKELNLIVMGEDTAHSLGMHVERTKKVLLVVASFVAAASVSVSGIIGFVGLIIPHIVRLVLGPDHRVLMPASIIAGAVFLIMSDTLARVLIPPIEIPVGVITALCGAPFFLYLLRKKRNGVRYTV